MRSYHDVADQLREQIEAFRENPNSGRFPGWVLPSQAEMAGQLEVSIDQYRDALAELRHEGEVRSRRGRPTLIRRVPVIDRDAQARFRNRESGGARGAFEAELARYGFRYEGEPGPQDAITVIPAPDEGVRAMLGDRVLVRPRLMYAVDGDGKRWPVQLADSWLPVDITEGTQIEQLDTGPGGTYSRLAELGHEVTEMEEMTVTRIPGEREAEFLDLDELYGRVYRIRRIASEASGRPVEVTDTIVSTFQVRLIYRWPA